MDLTWACPPPILVACVRSRTYASDPSPIRRAECTFGNETAPIPAWITNDPQFGLNRGGNRQVNAALHRIAITQWRCDGSSGHGYVNKRTAQGNTKTDALRLLRRRLCDEVFRRFLSDEAAETHSKGAKLMGSLRFPEPQCTTGAGNGCCQRPLSA